MTPGRWDGALRAFSRNRGAVAGALGVVVLLLVALLAPLLAPFDPTRQGDLLTGRLLPPSGTHLLGTDPFARDVFSRLLHGARVSLSIALLAMGIAVTLGTLVGVVAGYLGGWVDRVLVQVTDAFLAIPRLVLLIAVVAVFEPSLAVVIFVLGFTQWPQVARFARAETLSLREREYVQAARALGFSRPRILFRHILPGALPPVIVAGTLGVGETIVLEAGLSFLGFGVQPPIPSWGGMVAEGRVDLLGAWWISTFSGLAIVFAVVAFNLAGDGLRDALDPRDRG
jgi:peptide/nickel transport system permease protein